MRHASGYNTSMLARIVAAIALTLTGAAVTMSGCKAREAQPDDPQQAFLGRIGDIPSGVALPQTTVGLPFEQPPAEVRARSLRTLRPAPSSPDVVPWDTTFVSLSKIELRVPLTGLVLPVPPDADTNGFEERYKAGGRSDYAVVPLAQALERVSAEWKPVRAVLGRDLSYAPVVVFADKDAPRRALAELMYTLGQSGSSPIRVAGRRGTELVAFDPPLPKVSTSLPQLLGTSDGGAFTSRFDGEAVPISPVEQVLREHHRELKQCYRDGLVRHPGLEGKLLVRIQLDSAPPKVTFDVSRTTLADEDTKTCIAHVLGGLAYPLQDAGGSAHMVLVPLNFVDTR